MFQVATFAATNLISSAKARRSERNYLNVTARGFMHGMASAQKTSRQSGSIQEYRAGFSRSPVRALAESGALAWRPGSPGTRPCCALPNRKKFLSLIVFDCVTC